MSHEEAAAPADHAAGEAAGETPECTGEDGRSPTSSHAPRVEQAPITEQAPIGQPSPRALKRLRGLMEGELALAERDVKHGPGGTGWAYNESKREEAEEWADLLRLLVSTWPFEG